MPGTIGAEERDVRSTPRRRELIADLGEHGFERDRRALER
jgi:hypothetical protein